MSDRLDTSSERVCLSSIQVRDDGVRFDQIVLSPTTYLNTPPGPASNDATIVPKP